MCIRTLIALLTALVLTAPAYAKSDALQVVVADPYIELHTGPGRGYPVFHVVDRGATIDVVKQRTSWYEVRTDRDVVGWVSEEQLARTLDASGEPVAIAEPGWAEFEGRRWETAIGFGDFDGASSISLTGSYRFSPNFSVGIMGDTPTRAVCASTLPKSSLLRVPSRGRMRLRLSGMTGALAVGVTAAVAIVVRGRHLPLLDPPLQEPAGGSAGDGADTGMS